MMSESTLGSSPFSIPKLSASQVPLIKMPNEETKQPEATEEEQQQPMVDAENEPPKKKSLKRSWERELVKQLDVTWKDAVTLIRLAKTEMEIPLKSCPDDQKEAVFERAVEIADSDDFDKSPMPGETVKEVDDFADGKWSLQQ